MSNQIWRKIEEKDFVRGKVIRIEDHTDPYNTMTIVAVYEDSIFTSRPYAYAQGFDSDGITGNEIVRWLKSDLLKQDIRVVDYEMITYCDD